MAYSPKKQEGKFDPSPSGIATISLLKNKKLGVRFVDDNDNEWAGDKFKISTWPDYVANPKLLPENDRKWFVRLGNDEKSIFSIAPVSGMFTGRCIGFASKEGEPPVPKTSKANQYGTYQYFLALVEITGGDDACVGMTLTYFLRYNFGEDDEGNTWYTNWNSDSAVHSPKLDEFLKLTGAWDKGAVPFTDNVLPKFHKRILRANKSFQFVMKAGWIDNFYEDDSIPADPVWEEDKPKKKKKKGKKNKAPDTTFDETVEDQDELDWD